MSVQLKRKRRVKGDTGRVLALGPHVGRAPRRSGAPQWFSAALVGRLSGRDNRKLRELLVKLPVQFLEKFDIPQSTLDLLSGAGLENVWALSLAPSSLVNGIRGLAPRSRTKLRRVLLENSVRVNWSVV
jgi:hypothetical protein